MQLKLISTFCLYLQLNIDTYFTRPYTTQDKGTVENKIGVIRNLCCKRTNLLFVTKIDVKLIKTKLNNRPVKKINYLILNQTLHKKVANTA